VALGRPAGRPEDRRLRSADRAWNAAEKTDGYIDVLIERYIRKRPDAFFS
jgi:hypothetical protein